MRNLRPVLWVGLIGGLIVLVVAGHGILTGTWTPNHLGGSGVGLAIMFIAWSQA